MQAYPSAAFDLALLLEKRDQALKIPFLYTSSEPLYRHQRDLIERRLAMKVMDFYGMAERVAFGTECEQGALHINSDYSHVEIVDERGQPTRGEGYVVGTTYHNLAMPLIRYRLTDRTRWLAETCACGRPFPQACAITGKFEDSVFGAQGQRISPSVITFIFKGLNHIQRSQVAQVGAGVWELRVVPMAGFGQAERDLLVRNLHAMVDPQLTASVVEVTDIPRTPAGKYRWIVNEHRAADVDTHAR